MSILLTTELTREEKKILLLKGSDSPISSMLELEPYNLTARCVNGRGIVTFKVSCEVGGWVGMENPLEMMHIMG